MKLLMDFHGKLSDAELYDMDKDKYETTNLAADHKKLVQQLAAKLNTWRMYLPDLTPDRTDPPKN